MICQYCEKSFAYMKYPKYCSKPCRDKGEAMEKSIELLLPFVAAPDKQEEERRRMRIEWRNRDPALKRK
jgi:hypothetical protein